MGERQLGRRMLMGTKPQAKKEATEVAPVG